MGIQKQIDNLKGKLQETQERRKRQEDLIMKVENLALKVSAVHHLVFLAQTMHSFWGPVQLS